MNYFDKYKKRIQAYGNNEADAYKNSTIMFIQNNFTNSHTYKQILINDVPTDVRIEKTDKSNEITLLFRPGTVFSEGTYCEINSKNWIIMIFVNDEIFPKAKAQLCNEILRWKDENDNVITYPCVATNLKYIKYAFDEHNKYGITTLDGGIYVYVQHNSDTIKIKPKQRFILGSQVYEIQGIDDVTNTDENDKGIIVFTAMLTEKKTTDDFTNKIADNSHLYFDGGSSPPPSGGEDWW